MAKKKPLTVKPVSREIIENNLLAALDDKSKVALILSHDDLCTLIDSLSKTFRDSPKQTEMLRDLMRLESVIFGVSGKKSP